jgi:AcrR family transcriptional regulator
LTLSRRDASIPSSRIPEVPLARRYHHGDLRSALLDAGEAVLDERGVAGFTLRECARRAGVSHAAPAHHFGDVAGLLAGVAARGFERLVEALQRERARYAADDRRGRMIATARAYVGFARAHPHRFRTMFRVDLLDLDSPELLAAVQRTYAVLTEVILLHCPDTPRVDPQTLDAKLALPGLVEDILIGWCHVHGLAHLLIEGQLDAMKGDDEDAFLERVITDTLPRLSDVLVR